MRVTDALVALTVLSAIFFFSAMSMENRSSAMASEAAVEPWNMFIGGYRKAAALPFDSKEACLHAATSLQTHDPDLHENSLGCFGQTSGKIIVIDRRGNIEELK